MREVCLEPAARALPKARAVNAFHGNIGTGAYRRERYEPKHAEARMASVLITGASKGIGLEAALAFGRAGHRVHATMRNPSQSPELAETAARERLPITVSTMMERTDSA
jgi:hypothetical protein